jgi:hypothetical protein
VNHHVLVWLAGVAAGVLATVAASFATRFELLPEVVDPSLILTCSGLGGLIGAAYAALRQFPAERLGKVILLGNLVGAGLALIVVIALVAGVPL